ncbi:unnamed protein product [Diamesa serratosioi]
MEGLENLFQIRSPSPVSSLSASLRTRRLSATKSDLIKFEIECLKFSLKETVDKLIIANGGEKASSHIRPSETKKPMKIRYKESREKLFHEQTLDPINEAMERMVFVKLGTDVAQLRKILSDTINDLDSTNDFKCLKILIDTEIRLEAEERNLIEQNSNCEILYKFLEKKFDEDTNIYKTKVKYVDDEIANIKSELDDFKGENKIKLRVLNDWESTRYGQLKFITESKEKQLSTIAHNYKQDSTRELRLKHEIESKLPNLILSCFRALCFLILAFLLNQNANYEDLTQQWKKKYERELQHLDEQINETKDVMIALKLKYDVMNMHYCSREEEIRDYLEERKIREDELILVERRNEAAVKIQAWWRGIMLFYSFFKSLVGKDVVVELKNDLSICGTLHSVDQYLNIKLTDISVTDPDKYPHMLSVKNCFIRGSVVRYVQLPSDEIDTQLLQDASRKETVTTR